jgi:hypothetical protein
MIHNRCLLCVYVRIKMKTMMELRILYKFTNFFYIEEFLLNFIIRKFKAWIFLLFFLHRAGQ